MVALLAPLLPQPVDTPLDLILEALTADAADMTVEQKKRVDDLRHTIARKTREHQVKLQTIVSEKK